MHRCRSKKRLLKAIDFLEREEPDVEAALKVLYSWRTKTTTFDHEEIQAIYKMLGRAIQRGRDIDSIEKLMRHIGAKKSDVAMSFLKD